MAMYSKWGPNDVTLIEGSKEEKEKLSKDLEKCEAKIRKETLQIIKENEKRNKAKQKLDETEGKNKE